MISDPQRVPQEPKPFSRALWDRWVREMKADRAEAQKIQKPACPCCGKPMTEAADG